MCIRSFLCHLSNGIEFAKVKWNIKPLIKLKLNNSVILPVQKHTKNFFKL